MRDHPDTDLLLASARRALLDQVVPQLEGEARGVALMVARTLSVVAARLQVDARTFALVDSGKQVDELISLANLLGVSPRETQSATGDTYAAIRQLTSRLVAEIRAGHFDPGAARHEDLRRFVTVVTRAKVAESNPKALEHIGQDEGESL